MNIFLPAAGLLGLLALDTTRAQAPVPNDDLSRRIALRPEAAPFVSSTAYCTVDWHCVPSPAERQIEYHNDQWFSFTPPRAGTYYINVAGQSCRDARGVQLVVLDGTPCQPATYRTLACVSLSTQDDFYAQLDGLVAGRTYLLSVDGYLSDFCQFNIRVSQQPTGFPTQLTSEAAVARVQREGQRVELGWEITEVLAGGVVAYEVWRRTADDRRWALRQTLPHQRNTRGESQLAYQATDSLPDGRAYHYQVIARRQDAPPLLLADQPATAAPPRVATPPPSADHLTLALRYPARTRLSVLVVDDQSGVVLRQLQTTVARKGEALRVFVGHFVDRGVKRFRVHLSDHRRNPDSQEYRFRL